MGRLISLVFFKKIFLYIVKMLNFTNDLRICKQEILAHSFFIQSFSHKILCTQSIEMSTASIILRTRPRSFITTRWILSIIYLVRYVEISQMNEKNWYIFNIFMNLRSRLNSCTQKWIIFKNVKNSLRFYETCYFPISINNV